MMGPVAAAGIHALVLVGAWALGRVGAARCPGRLPGAGRTAAQFGRRVALVAVLTAPLVALSLGTDAAISSWLRTHLPGLGPDTYASLSSFVLFLGPVPVTAFLAYRGAHSGAATPPTRALTADVRRFAAGYLLLTGPALVVVALSPLVPDGWWLVAGLVVVGLALAVIAPLVVPRLAPTRELTRLERERLDAPTAVPVVVVDAGRYCNALAAGVVPGLQTVFVTDALLRALPPAEVSAVLAHEVGHLRRHHVLLRLGAVALLVCPWIGATAAEVPGAFYAGLVCLGPATLALLAVMRWTERDADRYARRVGDPAALARALARLSTAEPRGRVASLLAPHPAPQTRIERARAKAKSNAPETDGWGR